MSTLTPRARARRELEALIGSRLALAADRIISCRMSLHHAGPGSERFEIELVAAMSELDQAERLHLSTPRELIRPDPILKLFDHHA